MQGDEIDRSIDQIGEYRSKLDELSGDDTVVKELLQNADDSGAVEVTFHIGEDALVVSNPVAFSSCDDPSARSCGLVRDPVRDRPCDLHSFRSVSGGPKRLETDRELTGAFGVGFVSVYLWTDLPEVVSAGVHWKVKENTSTIDSSCSGCEYEHDRGATFVLPWAQQDSDLRRGLAKPVVPRGGPTGLLETIRHTASVSLLFLRHVRTVTILKGATRLVLRRSDGDRHGPPNREHWERQIDDAGDLKRWLMLSGHDYSQTIDELRESDEGRHALGHRKTFVEVALQMSDDPAPGHLSATLPTRVGLVPGLSINGAFLLKTDRKRLSDYEIHASFNSHLLRTAANVLAENLELVAHRVPNRTLLRMLAKLDDQAGRGNDEGSVFFDHFWREAGPRLASSRVLLGHRGSLVAPSDTWDDGGRLSDREELAEVLGVTLVHPDVRDEADRISQRLRIRSLKAATVASRAAEVRERGHWPSRTTAAPAWFVQLQSLVGDYGSDRSFDSLPIVPTSMGVFVGARESIRRHSVPGFLAPLLGSLPAAQHDQMPERAWKALKPFARVYSQVDVVKTLAQHVDFATAHVDGVLEWFAEQRPLDRVAVDRLVQLPIYPTNFGPRTLDEAHFPDFEDPLGTSEIPLLDVGRLKRFRGFLVSQLRASTLDVATYVRLYAVPALVNGVPAEHRELILRLVAAHLRHIQADDSVLDALATAPLLPIDRAGRLEWHVAAAVRAPGTQADGVDGVRVLPHVCPVDGVVDEDWQRLIRMLSVPEHVSLEELRWAIDTAARRQDPELSRRLLRTVVAHPEAAEGDSFLLHQSPAVQQPWLPTAAGTVRRPRELYLRSEAEVLDDAAMIVDHPSGAPARTFLTRIGVNARAPLTLVVERATRVAESGADMPSVVYERLASADATALSEFRDRRIIQFAPGAAYYRPSQLFFGGREVTGYAIVVPEEFASRHRDLLRKLDVREKADHQVALRVLHDAHGHSTEARPGVVTVRQAWHLLHEHGALAASTLAGLRCLPIGNGDLRRPDECFFVDPRGLVHEFHALKGRLVERDSLEETYRAAGVRPLDGVLDVRVTPEAATHDDGFERWLRDFYPLLERIALHGVRRDHEKPASALKARLEALTVKKASSLRQTLALNVGGLSPETIEKSVPAYLEETGTLFVQGGFDDVRHRGSSAVVLVEALTDYVFVEASNATRQRANSVLRTLIREDDVSEGADILAAEGIDQSPIATDNPWATSTPSPEHVGSAQENGPDGDPRPDKGPADDDGALGRSELGAAAEVDADDGVSDASVAGGKAGSLGTAEAEPEGSSLPLTKGWSTGEPIDRDDLARPGSPPGTPPRTTAATTSGAGTKPPDSASGTGGSPRTPSGRGRSPQPHPQGGDLPRATPGASPDGSLSDEPVPIGGGQTKDPEQVRTQAAAKARSNPKKAKAHKIVSADVSRPYWDKKDSRRYLFGQYHDAPSIPRRPVCQICRRPSSFRTRDGEWYFEAVLLYPQLNHEDRFNRLALCPVCSAKLRLGSSTPPAELADWAREVGLSTGQPTIEREILLAGIPAKITFTTDHLARIQGGLDHHDRSSSP